MKNYVMDLFTGYRGVLIDSDVTDGFFAFELFSCNGCRNGVAYSIGAEIGMVGAIIVGGWLWHCYLFDDQHY
ncbi:MAG: hypothetical protein ACI4UB_06275 [Limosilactobacillus sp.]